MIRIVYGSKGSGKTKRMIAMANDAVHTAKGTVVFIARDSSYMYSLNRGIRFTDASEYGLDGRAMFMGFVSGIASQDFDLETLYIDGFVSLIGDKPGASKNVLDYLEKLSEKHCFDIVLSMSSDEPAPDFIQELII